MAKDKTPKLRTVNKSLPPFRLKEFPKEFPFKLAKELVYLLASKGKAILEGSEWEAVFARCIGAEWKPSNVGLDDVILGNTAWGAKTVKSVKPSTQKKVRLISGRNSPVYSYGDKIDTKADANVVGKSILDIWNERISAIREKFQNLRTVVLIKSNDLNEVVVFEFDTIRYDPELFAWEWNKNSNLVGIEKSTENKRFTWQPHGSQFTIIENVSAKSLIIRVKQPKALNKDAVLNALGLTNLGLLLFTKMSDTFSRKKRSEIMRLVKSSRNKSTELKLINFFRVNNIKGWRRNYKLFGKPDFTFPVAKSIIFVDGCFWHGHNCRNTQPKKNKDYWTKKLERNRIRDKKVTKYLTKNGWTVTRFWECELRNEEILLRRLKAKLQPTR